MFPELRRNPASLLLIGIVAGLVVCDHVGSPQSAALFTGVAGLLVLALPRPIRVGICLLLFSISIGLLIAFEQIEEHRHNIETVRSLPPDRFVLITAPIDREWIASRDGKRARVDRFEVQSGTGTHSIREPLSIYVPETVEPIGEHDRISVEGFLRESRNGRFYVAVKSFRLVELRRERPDWHPRRWNRRIRFLLDCHVEIFPEHTRAAGLVRAVALGDGSALTTELRDSYRRGGTYHLLVFSGMQIAFAAALVSIALRRLRLYRATDLSLVLLALLAPMFAGNDPSVGRASMMLGVFGVSRLLGRPTPISNLLFLSAALRLLLRPDELTSPGFLLTYAATFGLVVVGAAISRTTSRPATLALAYGVGAELCTQPLTLLFFRHYTVGGFLITILLSPLLSAIIVLSIPIALALMIGSDLAAPLLSVVSIIDHGAVTINDLAGTLKLTGIAPAPSELLVVTSFFAAGLIAFSRIAPSIRALFVVLSLSIVPASVALRDHREDLRPSAIEFLDVGQGDATLIRGTAVVLVDGGGSPGDTEFGRRTLIPLLADRGIDRIDVVAMSHPDIDHCGGLIPLVKTVPVSEIWISSRHLRAPCTNELLAGAPASRVRFLRDGDEIEIGDLRVAVTIPRLPYKKSPTNNGSVVLTATTDGGTVLLSGDVEQEAEADLIEDAATRLRADLLKVPHHGSGTSSSGPFLDGVRPRIALISCELDNLYGHPAPDVLERLEKRSIHVLRTDRSGTIRVELSRTRARISTSAGNFEVSLTRRTPTS